MPDKDAPTKGNPDLTTGFTQPDMSDEAAAGEEAALGFYDQQALEEEQGLGPRKEGESDEDYAKRRKEAEERLITDPDDQPEEVK